MGPHFNPLADCCFSAVAPELPQAEVLPESFEEGNKEKRNFIYHPTYATSYKTKKPYTSYHNKPKPIETGIILSIIDIKNVCIFFIDR